MESFSPHSENFAVWVLLFVLGTALGSFANVCIRRIPAGISVVFPPSRCESCETPIRAFHNIPLFGWLSLMGRCHHCKARISVEYPLVELLSGALALVLYREFGPSPEFVLYLAFSLSLVVVTFIDMRHLLIPDAITVPGTIAGIALSAYKTDWHAFGDAVFSPGFQNFLLTVANTEILDSLGGMLLGGGTFFLIARGYSKIRKTEGLGMGDVKLISMLGAFLGTGGVIVVIFLSSALGTLAGLAMIIFRNKDARDAIPYGPFLSVSALGYLLGDGISVSSVLNRGFF